MVPATCLSAIFFNYCVGIAGNNSVGFICNHASFVLSRPMRCVEVVLNGIILKPISNLVGVPLLLNDTQEILKGKGIAFEKINNLGIFTKIKKNLSNFFE